MFFHLNELDDEKSEKILLQQLTTPKSVTITQDGELVSSEELVFMSFTTIKSATNDFSDSNKLGQGGFGSVYKVGQSLKFHLGLSVCVCVCVCV